MKEYKITKGSAIFIWIKEPVLIALFGFVAIMPFLVDKINLILALTSTPISIGVVIIKVFELVDASIKRFIIKKDGFVAKGVFKTKELRFEEIKGFTVTSEYIFVYPNTKDTKRIRISQYNGGYYEILSWLTTKYENLDKKNTQTEIQEILNDENIGRSREIREVKLSNAKKIAKTINWLGIISFAWILVYPKPYDYALLTALIIPIIATIATKLSRGLIRIDEKNESAYPSTATALYLPIFGLLWRTFFDYEIFDYSNVWLKSAVVTIVFIFVLLLKQKEFTFKKKEDCWTILSLIILLFAYSYSAVIYLNCNLDKTEPEHFTATILDKRISSGNHRLYYLKLTAWGKQTEIDEVSVSEGLYKRVEVDKEIHIYFRNGKFQIPWYTVTD